GRPEEDYREQEPRREIERARDRGPADERWDRARSATDDDVLRGRALEPDRVHEDVEDRAAERERRRQQIREHREHDERGHVQCDAPPDRDTCGDSMGWEWPSARAPHPLVDIAIEVVIQARGTAARGRATDEGRGEEPERWHAALSQEHAAERGQKKERHDRGLRQRDEITDERTLLRRWAPRDRGEADNAAPQKACDGGMRAEGPRREATQRIRCADRDLHDKNHGGRDRERTEPRRIPSVTPRFEAGED